MQGLVEDAIAKALIGLIPAMMQSLLDWINGGRVGLCPVPSMGGSNSANVVSEPVVITPVLELNAPIMENLPDDTAPTSTPSITCTPADKGIDIKAHYLSTPGAHSGNSPTGIMPNHSYSRNTR
jgi:hypothetical protein